GGGLADAVLQSCCLIPRRAQHAEHDAAVVVTPGGPVGCERVRPKSPVAVDRGRGKRGGGGGICDQAAEKGATERRQMFALAFGHEQVASALAVEERLMEVPAAGVIALERRPAHERGEMSHPAADLPRRGAKEERVIRRLQRRSRGERALDLPRSPLVLDRS